MNEMDRMTENSAQYIKRWQQQQAQDIPKCTYFFLISLGSRFRLPGGSVCQVKSGLNTAQTGSNIVSYWPWERVVPVD